MIYDYPGHEGAVYVYGSDLGDVEGCSEGGNADSDSDNDSPDDEPGGIGDKRGANRTDREDESAEEYDLASPQHVRQTAAGRGACNGSDEN